MEEALAYVSLYRKYRSQTFSDLVGQDHVVRTLQNAIGSSRIAHSYLFTGPRGTGKTSSARLLAKALCCEKGLNAEPCNECETCVSITNGSCVDVFEMDAASDSGVDDIREAIVENVEYAPSFCRYKIFIIDEVHDLSPKAFDALLKTVEEPPPYVIFILATTEFNKVPPTIRSRCQKFEFHRASLGDLVQRLTHVATAEGVEIEPAALSAIARMADGGYRDALTLLEQAILTSDGAITLEQVYDQLGMIGEELVDSILLAIKESDTPKIIESLSEVARMGRDPRSLLESLLYRLSDLTRAAYGVEIGASLDATREAALRETAAQMGRERLLQIRSALAEAHKTIRDISLPRLWLESELLRLATAAPIPIASAPIAKSVQAQPAPVQQPAAKPAPVVQEAAPMEVHKEPEQQPVAEKPAAPSSGDPELDRAQNAWLSVVQALSTESKLMAMKLGGTSVAGVEGQMLRIAFQNQVEHDWVAEGPKRRAAILEKLKLQLGEEWDVEYQVLKTNGYKKEEPIAVEIPMEGQSLHDATSAIIGQT